MSDDQSKLLGECLEGRASFSDLEPDVRQTLWAFRPDLAPLPRFDLDSVLNSLVRGPFSSATDGEPVDEEDGDDSDLRALFRLDELAEPTLKVEHIFDSLTQGPLSDKSVSSSPDNVVPLFRRMLTPAFGGLMAVACALIILLPTDFRYEIPQDPEPVSVKLSSGDESDMGVEKARQQAASTPENVVAEQSDSLEFDSEDAGIDMNTRSAPRPRIAKKKRPSSKSKRKNVLPSDFILGGNDVGKSKKESAGRGALSVTEDVPPAPSGVFPQNASQPSLGTRGSASGDAIMESRELPSMKSGSGTRTEMSSERSLATETPAKEGLADSFEGDDELPTTAEKEPAERSERLEDLKSEAWDFGTLENGLIEPLRSRVDNATSASDLYALMGGGVDDDLEIAYRIALKDARLGRKALEASLSLPGGRASLRRRAWAKLGDLHFRNGDRSAARKAYMNALPSR